MPDQQRTALIVGASRGLGLGLTRELLSRGWHVIATARKPDAARDLGALASGATLEVRALDLDEPGSFDGFRDGLRGITLDVLFLNAGVAGPAHRSADQATPEEIGALMFTNAIAPVRLARLLSGEVRDRTGIVAFMSSLMGSVGANTSGNHELYRASKAALNSLTRGFAANPGARKVTVLTLHPGWVQTDMGGASAPVDVPTSVRGIADVLERHPRHHGHDFLDYQGKEIPW